MTLVKALPARKYAIIISLYRRLVGHSTARYFNTNDYAAFKRWYGDSVH